MKHPFLKIFLIFFFIPSIAYTMDLAPVYTRIEKTILAESNVLIDTILNTIDGALTKTYAGKTNFLGNLSQEHMVDVVTMVGTSIKSITSTSKLISKVYAKNNLFKQSIDHFTALARKDLDNVTIDTIIIMEQQKCTPKLIELPKTIATYITKLALSTLKSHYYMEFSDHNEALITYDICPTTDQAASTGKDKSLRIYSLKQGKQVFIKYENNVVSALCFNNDGSQLATLVSYWLIKIWDPRNYTLLYSIDTLDPIYSLHYNKGLAQNILSACATVANTSDDTEIQDVIFQWDTSKNETPCSLGMIPICGNPGETQHYLTKKPYTLTRKTFDSTSFTIRKTECDSFCLLKKAVANTQHPETLNKIERLSTYQELTDYEKHMIQQETQNKKNYLRRSLPTKEISGHSQTTQLLTNKY